MAELKITKNNFKKCLTNWKRTPIIKNTKMPAIKITSENFESEVVNSGKTFLLDFWAPWCGPCRMLAPVIEELANEYDGKVKVGKVNVDEEGELAGHFGISSIPTVVVIKNKTIIDKSIGYVPKSKLDEMIKSAL